MVVSDFRQESYIKTDFDRQQWAGPDRRWASTLVDSSIHDEPGAPEPEGASPKPEGTAPTSQPKKHKIKRKRPALRQPPKAFVSQLKAREFYDELAPLLPLKVMRDLCIFLKKRKKMSSAQGTFSAKMELLWKDEPNQENIPPKWVRKKLMRLLMGGTDKRSNTNKIDPVLKKNREEWETKITVLMQAREASVQKPLFWSVHEEKLRKSELASAAPGEADGSRTSSIDSGKQDRSVPHKAKTPDMLREEAETFLAHLADTLPSESFDEWMDAMKTSIESGTLRTSLSGSKFLMKHVYHCTTSHVHLVSAQIAEFFYLEISQAGQQSDKRELQAIQQWELVRETFAQTLPAFQRALVEQKAPTKKQVEEEAIDVTIKMKAPVKPNENKVVKRRSYHIQLDAMMLTDTMPVVPRSDKMVFIDNLPIDIAEMELFDLYSRCGPIQSVSIFNQRLDLDPGPLNGKQVQARKDKHRMNRTGTDSKKWKSPKTPLYGLITFSTQEGFDAASDSPLRLFGMVVRKHAIRSVRAADLTTLYVDYLPRGLHSADLEYQLAKVLKEQGIYVCLDLGQHTKSEPTSCEIRFPSFEAAYSSYDIVRESVELLSTSLKEFEITEEEKSSEAVNWLRTPPNAMKYWTRQMGFDT
jgi:hypothetical protein